MTPPPRPPDAAAELPTGVVTFLMTDVEASTRLWRRSAGAAEAMTCHVALIDAAVARHGGVRPLEQGEGDSTVAAFARPTDALNAAVEAQRALEGEPGPEGARVRARMAVHTGEAELRDQASYGGATIIRCARLRALAYGGQVLVSAATGELVGDRLPPDAMLLALDRVRLEGFETSERVYQLCHPALPSGFGPLRAARARGLRTWPTGLVGRAREREQVRSLVEPGRLLTITGTGGAGKTRLAHAVAEDTGAGDMAVVWAELAPLADEAQVAGAVAAACGVRETPGLSALEVLATGLADTDLLVVLDNCEHLLDGSAHVAEAPLRAGVRLLARSREPLGVP